MFRRSFGTRWGAACCGWMVAALAMTWLAGVPAAAQSKRTTVAILPIVVHATEDREYLRSGLADMLASRLGRENGVAVIRVDDPEQATTDVAVAQKAARAAGAEWALFGSFTRFGDGASLDVRCVSVAGDAADPRSVFVQAGTLGDIIPRLDNLAKRVAHHLTSGASSLPAPVGAGPAEGEADMVGDAFSELDALRGRVEALERKVYTEGDAENTAAR